MAKGNGQTCLKELVLTSNNICCNIYSLFSQSGSLLLIIHPDTSYFVGLRRCGKSCRLRWLNYLRPDIKRGNFSEDEEDLIIKLHKLLGNRYGKSTSSPPEPVQYRCCLEWGLRFQIFFSLRVNSNII